MLLHTFAQVLDKNKVEIPQTTADPGTFNDIRLLALGVIAAVSVLIISIAGLQYVLSQGDPQRVAKAKNTIIYTVVGLVISIAAVSIIAFVVERLWG